MRQLPRAYPETQRRHVVHISIQWLKLNILNNAALDVDMHQRLEVQFVADVCLVWFMLIDQCMCACVGVISKSKIPAYYIRGVINLNGRDMLKSRIAPAQ